MEDYVLSRSGGRGKCVRSCSGEPSASTACAPREAVGQLCCRGSTAAPWLPLQP